MTEEVFPGHPPKNRLAEPLELLRIEIRHADGVLVVDPNNFLLAEFKGQLGGLRPAEKWRSVLSGAPGVLWRSHDVEAALTVDELRRLARRALMPDEALALIERYGMFYEVHDDFYDPDGGVAFQPVDDDAYERELAAWREKGGGPRP